MFGFAWELQNSQWTGNHILLNTYVCFYKTDLTRFPLYSLYKRNPEGTDSHLLVQNIHIEHVFMHLKEGDVEKQLNWFCIAQKGKTKINKKNLQQSSFQLILKTNKKTQIINVISKTEKIA